MSRELPQDMFSMGGAHADLRETGQAIQRHVQLGTHLPGQECYVLAGWLKKKRKIISKFQVTSRNWSSKWRSCKHCSSLVQWRSQKSSNAVSVSSSWPSSLMGSGGWLVHTLAGIRHIIISNYSAPYLCTVAKFSTSSWVMLYSGSVRMGSLIQSNRRPPWDSATCRSSWKFEPALEKKNVAWNQVSCWQSTLETVKWPMQVLTEQMSCFWNSIYVWRQNEFSSKKMYLHRSSVQLQNKIRATSEQIFQLKW